MEFLFNDASQVDVVLLDNQEMRETKGEFWKPILSGIGSGLGFYAVNCLFFGKCRNWRVNVSYPMP